MENSEECLGCQVMCDQFLQRGGCILSMLIVLSILSPLFFAADISLESVL